MEVNGSMVGFRWQCSRFIRHMAKSPNYGVIQSCEITRVGIFTWHLIIKTESK